MAHDHVVDLTLELIRHHFLELTRDLKGLSEVTLFNCDLVPIFSFHRVGED